MKMHGLNKRERMSRNEMIAAGLDKYCAKALIFNDGETVKAAEAIRLFEDASVAEKKATASRAQYLADVAAARTANAKAKVLVAPIKNLVTGIFGKKSPIVAEFGFGPVANMPSAEARYEAVEKLRATRIARGTRGSRQKAAIHGQVESSAAPATEVPTELVQPLVASVTNGTHGTNGTAQTSLLALNGSH